MPLFKYPEWIDPGSCPREQAACQGTRMSINNWKSTFGGVQVSLCVCCTHHEAIGCTIRQELFPSYHTEGDLKLHLNTGRSEVSLNGAAREGPCMGASCRSKGEQGQRFWGRAPLFLVDGQRKKLGGEDQGPSSFNPAPIGAVHSGRRDPLPAPAPRDEGPSGCLWAPTTEGHRHHFLSLVFCHVYGRYLIFPLGTQRAITPPGGPTKLGAAGKEIDPAPKVNARSQAKRNKAVKHVVPKASRNGKANIYMQLHPKHSHWYNNENSTVHDLTSLNLIYS